MWVRYVVIVLILYVAIIACWELYVEYRRKRAMRIAMRNYAANDVKMTEKLFLVEPKYHLTEEENKNLEQTLKKLVDR